MEVYILTSVSSSILISEGGLFGLVEMCFGEEEQRPSGKGWGLLGLVILLMLSSMLWVVEEFNEEKKEYQICKII